MQEIQCDWDIVLQKNRQKPDCEEFYKQHKEFELHPEGGLQGNDMYVISK